MLLEQKGSVAANMRPTVSSVCVLLERKGSVAVNMPPSVSSVCVLFEQKGSVAASMRPTVLLRPVKGLTSLPPVYIHSCFVLYCFVCLFVVVVVVVVVAVVCLLFLFLFLFFIFLSANATACLYIIFEVLYIAMCSHCWFMALNK